MKKKKYWNCKGSFIRYLSSEPIGSHLKQWKQIIDFPPVKIRMVQPEKGLSKLLDSAIC